MTTYLRVDQRLCSGHGRCYTVVPELLSCDDEGFVTLRGSQVEVDDALLAAAKRAVSSCPEDAISLVDE
jgi:ferredoxin